MTWKYWVNKEGKPMTGKYHYFKSLKVWKAFKETEFEQIRKFDFEQSFTGQFLKEGYETFGIALSFDGKGNKLYKKQINPTCNWFGISVYEPDTYFIKDDKVMLMSLQGFATPYNGSYQELFKNGAIKYIRMQVKDKILYETWTGNLPSKEIVKQFINA